MAKTGSIVITQGTQEIANNRTYITVTGKITTSGDSYRGDSRTGTYTIKQGSTVIKSGSFTHGAPANSTTTLFTVSLWVTHDASGNSGTITATYNYSDGWCTGTGSKTLTTIPRSATLSSAPNFTDKDNPTITYSNPAGNAVTSLQACISFTGAKDDIPYRDISKTGTSYTFNLTEAEKNTLISSIPNSTSRSVMFFVRTGIGGKTYYSTLTKTFTISADIKPSATLTVEEATDLQWGVYVQNVSKLNVAINATEAYGSEIASYKTTVGSNAYTANSFTTGTLATSGDLTITTTVTDKRGRTGTATKTINVLEYSNPIFTSFKVKRCNADGSENMQGEYGKISFACTCSGLDGRNTVGFNIEYKKTSEDEYTVGALLPNRAIDGSTGELTSIIPVSSDASYHIKITAYDVFKTTSQVTVLSTGFSIIHWLANGLGLAIGKLAELSNFLDIGFDAIFRKNIYMGYYHDEEKSINFRNEASHSGKTYKNDGMYPHNCKIYSGSSTSQIGIGMYDMDNDRRPFAYNDYENYVYTESVFRQQIAVGYPSAATSITSTGWTKVNIDSTNSTSLKGKYLDLSDGGIVCKRKGFVKISGQCYMTGLTAYDLVGVGIAKGSLSSTQSFCYKKQNYSTIYNQLTDYIIEVAEGDILYLVASNTSGARGTVSAGHAYTRLIVEYVG